MRKLRAILLASIILMSLSVLPTHSSRPMPKVTIEIHKDLSATMKAEVFRLIHEPETLYFSNVLKAPILNWINYSGNITLDMTQAGPRGAYSMIAIPRPGEPTRRASFFTKAAAAGQFNNATVYTMMNFFYGDKFLLLYGIRWNFVNVTYRITPFVNYTGITAIASCSTKDNKIKHVGVSYKTETQAVTGAMIVDYKVTVDTLPLDLRKSTSGYYYIDLTPLTMALPNDISANVWVNFTNNDIEVLGGSPTPKLVLWNDALWEFVPQLQESGKSLIVIIQKTEPHFPLQEILLASIPPIIVGAYVYWRIKFERERKGRSKEK